MRFRELGFFLVASLCLLSQCALALPGASGTGNWTSTSSKTSASVTGSGYSYALSCQSALDDYFTSSNSYVMFHNTPTTITDTLSATLGESITYTGTFTTLCDGIPRLVGNMTTITLATPTYSYTSTYTITRQDAASYPEPAPTCSVNPDDCLSLWSSYRKATQSEATITSAISTWAREPSCTTPGQTATCRAQDCIIAPQGEGVQLLYWPVSVEGDNLCDETGITKTFGPTGSGPNTFVTLGTTITSPDVGLLFGAISRQDGCGPTLRNYLLTLPPDQVYSQWGKRVYAYPKSFNVADLNHSCGPDGCFPLVPWSAYANAPGCYSFDGEEPRCEKTIWGNYAPQISYPAVMTTLEPAWGSSCGLNIVGVWDPAVLMASETSFMVPKATTAGKTTYTAESQQMESAMPSSTVGSPIAASTAAHTADTAQAGTAYPSSIVESIAAPTNTGEAVSEGSSGSSPSPTDASETNPTGIAGAIMSVLNGGSWSSASSSENSGAVYSGADDSGPDNSGSDDSGSRQSASGSDDTGDSTEGTSGTIVATVSYIVTTLGSSEVVGADGETTVPVYHSAIIAVSAESFDVPGAVATPTSEVQGSVVGESSVEVLAGSQTVATGSNPVGTLGLAYSAVVSDSAVGVDSVSQSVSTGYGVAGPHAVTTLGSASGAGTSESAIGDDSVSQAVSTGYETTAVNTKSTGKSAHMGVADSLTGGTDTGTAVSTTPSESGEVVGQTSKASATHTGAAAGLSASPVLATTWTLFSCISAAFLIMAG